MASCKFAWALGLLFVAYVATGDRELYQDEDEPYGWGSLETTIYNYTLNSYDIPMHVRMYYPVYGHDEYEFATHYFIGGFGGWIPSASYDNFLERIASHGYIVAGSWPALGEDGRNFSYEAHLETIDWLKANNDMYLETSSRWDLLSFNCHSAGCEPTLEMEYYDNDIIKAQIFYEPVSSAFRFKEPDGMGPALVFGAAEAGRCVVDAIAHVPHYNFYDCPAMLLEAQDFGHCDILDPGAWNACRVTNFCPPGGEEDEIEGYYDFSAGMAVSFMNAYQQDQMDYLEWLVERERIPIELSMYNVSCYEDDDVQKYKP